MNNTIFYMLQWWDGNGGTYIRTFDTYEEREDFKKLVERRDWRGQLNTTVWERTTADTVPFNA